MIYYDGEEISDHINYYRNLIEFVYGDTLLYCDNKRAIIVIGNIQDIHIVQH